MKWVEFVKKYADENKVSFKDAMQSDACKSQYKQLKESGEGILPSIRRDYKPEIRQFLGKYGDKKIKTITIQRVPIDSVLKGLLNALSLGTYEKQTQKLGYDKIFHLSMIVTLDGVSKPVVVEKNEVINIGFKIPPMKKGGARQSVPVNKDISLNELLENTRKVQGSNFFLYDAFKRNCQMFIRDLLKYSGLLTPEVEAFIMQDAKKILEGMPWYFSGLAKGLTDIGAQLDRIIYGKGKCAK
jgi:hypothetical protein